MSEQNLGERIKALRESKQISREQLYNRTKISVRSLEAIEEGRWDLLPGQAYLRPFIKSIAEALETDYDELISIIDKPDKKKTDHQQEEPAKKKRFDYRWPAVFAILIIVAAIIVFLKPIENLLSKNNSDAAIPVAQPENDHAILKHNYSSSADLQKYIVDPAKIHTLELVAQDSVWVVLTAGSDTLFTGTMGPGRVLKESALEPFNLFMGKPNCVVVKYDNSELDREIFLKDRRRVDFSKIRRAINNLGGG